MIWNWMSEWKWFLLWLDYHFIFGWVILPVRLSLYCLLPLLDSLGLHPFVLFHFISLYGFALFIHLELLYQLLTTTSLHFSTSFRYLFFSTLLSLNALSSALILLSTHLIPTLFCRSFHSFLIWVQNMIDDIGLHLVHSEPRVFIHQIKDLLIEILVFAVVLLKQTLHADDVLDVSTQVPLDVSLHVI